MIHLPAAPSHPRRDQPAPAGTVVVAPRSPALMPLIAAFSDADQAPASPEGAPPEGALERLLPAARIHLMVNLYEDEFRTYGGPDGSSVRRTRGAVLEGPHAQPRVIDTRAQRCLVTVSFKPGGAAPFFRAPLSEVRDQLIDLEHLWGGDATDLRERLLEAPTPAARVDLLEAALLDHLSGPQQPDPAMRYAAAALGRGVAVSQVRSRLGLLPKTFVRRFRAHTGLAPKRFARVRRLQRLLRSIGDPSAADWAALAAQHGYADQSHLIYDFRALTGLTPTAYRPRSAAARNHVPLTPAGG
ncbi:MAG TPA: helix-turn-helix domain-containing protein [Chloroflexota bacterium]|jgi:AraC-like DNA-binding protein|nr:helix-turn-helix domain-containing protein [Chloroflexota bacterium]